MSETREEVDAVEAIGNHEACCCTGCAGTLLDLLRSTAGLEVDGLVVLRYEGDAVTVAGRLEEKPIQWVADEPMPTLYQIVETGNPWGISTLESQPVVPHRCQACFGTRRGQYEETCWKCKGTGLLFRGATSPTPSIQPTAPPSPRSAQ
jgi:hypothetical protein